MGHALMFHVVFGRCLQVAEGNWAKQNKIAPLSLSLYHGQFLHAKRRGTFLLTPIQGRSIRAPLLARRVACLVGMAYPNPNPICHSSRTHALWFQCISPALNLQHETKTPLCCSLQPEKGKTHVHLADSNLKAREEGKKCDLPTQRLGPTRCLPSRGGETDWVGTWAWARGQFLEPSKPCAWNLVGLV